MIDIEQRLKDKEKAVVGLNRQLSIKEHVIINLRHELDDMCNRAIIAEKTLQPVKESLNRMTSENSKFKRKLKRYGIK